VTYQKILRRPKTTSARYNFNVQYQHKFENGRENLGKRTFYMALPKIKFLSESQEFFDLVITIEFSISGRVVFVVTSFLVILNGYLENILKVQIFLLNRILLMKMN
jgi:hypothetical protein